MSHIRPLQGRMGGRMRYAPTPGTRLNFAEARSPPGGFQPLQFVFAQNPAGFSLCNSFSSKTRRVSASAIRFHPKPGGFQPLQFVFIQNPAGFGTFSCIEVYRQEKRARLR